MKNRTAPKMKLPAVPVPDMSNLTKEKLKAEIEKGFADAGARRLTPAAEMFAELRENYLSAVLDPEDRGILQITFNRLADVNAVQGISLQVVHNSAHGEEEASFTIS